MVGYSKKIDIEDITCSANGTAHKERSRSNKVGSGQLIYILKINEYSSKVGGKTIHYGGIVFNNQTYMLSPW